MVRVPTNDARLMRAVESQHVVASFGKVFADNLTGQVAIATNADAESYVSMDENDEAEILFAKSKASEDIDVMISHTWSAGRYLKTLALLHYLNSTTALWACLFASCAGTAFAIIVWGKGDYTALGGHSGLVWAIQVFPVCVYIIFTLIGHVVWPCVNRNWWLDKVCIHQGRHTLKVQGVAMLPEVVSTAKRMVVLWSESYFSRLWCCDELATFTATHEGADAIDFVPLWLTPWILTSMCCDCLSAILCSYAVALIPLCGKFAQEQHFSPGVAVFFQYTVGIGFGVGLALSPSAIGNYICLNRKLQNHKVMMQHLENFSLKDAECTFESDRKWVENHVRQLFQHKSIGDPIETFNSYVRDEVRLSLVSRLGDATDLKIQTVWLALLPTMLGTLQNTLSCDFRDCYLTYKEEGETSVEAWMAGNIPGYFLCFFVFSPPFYAFMLKTMAWLSRRMRDGVLQEALKLGACVFYIFLSAFAGGVLNGLAKSSKLSGNPAWKVAFVLYFLFFIGLNLTLFHRRPHELRKIIRRVSGRASALPSLLGRQLIPKDHKRPLPP